MRIRIPEKTRGTGATVLFGLAGGATAVAFLRLTNAVFGMGLGVLAEGGPLRFALGSFAIVTVAMLAVGLLLFRFHRGAAGSGIPELKAAYWNDMGFVPWRAAWVKLAAGILSLGGGASLGREGPTVFAGAAVASTLAGHLGVVKHKRRAASVAGAAAGLAAAFNTPLAAITFVLEEIIGDLNSRFLGAGLLAALVGAFTAHAFLGRQPAFAVPQIVGASVHAYLLTPLVAAFAAGIGIAFQHAVLALRRRIRQRSRLPGWLRPLVGGWITWALGVSVFVVCGKAGVFSLGYEDLSTAMKDGIAWRIALLLLVAKFPATIASYAWGGCGGIFSPTLFMGAMAGFVVAGLAGQVHPLLPGESVLLASVGMSACFGAVVRAPLTSLLMIFEMTHQFELVPALMLGTLVSQFIARRASGRNFYEAILLQDGHELSHINPPRDLQAWQDQPVSVIANPRPVVLHGLAAPELREALDRYPFRAFPVEIDGRYAGVILRPAMETALAGPPPPL
ncbi:MAG: chloride channel protein, partial [Verrucomicrobia bacterium]|nr:chloride channel protein [Verrucomicrobiota bacterium]